MSPTCELQGVRLEIHEPVRRFAGAVESAFGGGLRAITLFGAATSDAFDPRRDSIRSAIVVDTSDLAAVFQFGKHGRAFVKQRFVAPWILSPANITASLDTFPLELLEIHTEGATIRGRDYFGGLSFQDTHIRLQCERELKSALIAIQQGLLSCAGDVRRLNALTEDAALGLARTLAGLLWIHGIRERRTIADRIQETEKLCGRDFSGIRVAMRADVQHDLASLERLYHDIERLGDYVNER